MSMGLRATRERWKRVAQSLLGRTPCRLRVESRGYFADRNRLDGAMGVTLSFPGRSTAGCVYE
jgi:hypothetical protein